MQFKYWKKIGISRIRDLFIQAKPISIGQLEKRNSQIISNLLQLIRIRNYANQLYNTLGYISTCSIRKLLHRSFNFLKGLT